MGTGVDVGSGVELGNGVAVDESPQATKTITTIENKAKIHVLFKRIIFTYPTPRYCRSHPSSSRALLK